MKASDRFDSNRGAPFGAFAAPAIEGEIRNHLRDRTPPVRIPRQQERIRSEIRHRRDELSSALGRMLTPPELAIALSVDEAEVERALNVERARDAASISSELDPTQLSAGSEALTVSDDRLVLASSLRSLDERERRIVFLRFHADMTERQIAGELGISQAHVSRLLSGALSKLRKELGGAGVSAEDGGITSDIVTSGNHSGDNEISGVRKAENRELPASGRQLVGEKGAHLYSGRFLVRMPQALHEELARAAEEQQISLNRLVTELLAAAVTQRNSGEALVTTRPPHDESDRPADHQRIPACWLRLALAINLVVVVLAGVVAVVMLVVALQRGI